MSKISVVLATYNEEANIEKCLNSVEGLADEIVIVDGTSQDKTVEIAKKFNAHIKVTDNPKIFHINKQKAIDLAKYDWILQLDADERVSKSLKDEIKKTTETENTLNGYYLPRKNYFLGRFLMKGGQYPDYTLRLYKNGKGRLPQKDVHEQAVVEGEVGHMKNSLLHYPYKDFTMYLKKWNNYTSIESMHIKSKRAKKGIIGKLTNSTWLLVFAGPIWFITTYIRHKGFMDSWQGFVFSFFSGLRLPVSFIKSLK